LKHSSELTESFPVAKESTRGHPARPSLLVVRWSLIKTSSQTVEHPDPGRSASEGMHPKMRKELFKVGTTRKEIGRVSHAGKVAQARKDSKS
jgi:hypothetical protein